MSEMTETFTSQNYYLCVVAIYGNYEPLLFNGRLILRTYYTDHEKTSIDYAKTSSYFIDTVFYEANKTIRIREDDTYDEPRRLVVETSPLLGEPYYVVYNENAAPSKHHDNRIPLFNSKEEAIRGLALIVKKTKEGQYTWLTEEEARSIQNQLKAMF